MPKSVVFLSHPPRRCSPGGYKPKIPIPLLLLCILFSLLFILPLFLLLLTLFIFILWRAFHACYKMSKDEQRN